MTFIRRFAYGCLYLTVAAAPWLLLVLAAAAHNWWLFIAPMVLYAAVITLAVCMRSAQISERERQRP